MSRTKEGELVFAAQQALSECNWAVGEAANEWHNKFAKGRSDADFAAMIGLSERQVDECRRVFVNFMDIRGRLRSVRWVHFFAALDWDDAAECLRWADDMSATVAEMRAWRRAQRGEDLTHAHR